MYVFLQPREDDGAQRTTHRRDTEGDNGQSRCRIRGLYGFAILRALSSLRKRQTIVGVCGNDLFFFPVTLDA